MTTNQKVLLGLLALSFVIALAFFNNITARIVGVVVITGALLVGLVALQRKISDLLQSKKLSKLSKIMEDKITSKTMPKHSK